MLKSPKVSVMTLHFCGGEHFNDSCDEHVDVVDGGNSYKDKDDVLFALELVICLNNIQLFL